MITYYRSFCILLSSRFRAYLIPLYSEVLDRILWKDTPNGSSLPNVGVACSLGLIVSGYPLHIFFRLLFLEFVAGAYSQFRCDSRMDWGCNLASWCQYFLTIDIICYLFIVNKIDQVWCYFSNIFQAHLWQDERFHYCFQTGGSQAYLYDVTIFTLSLFFVDLLVLIDCEKWCEAPMDSIEN